MRQNILVDAFLNPGYIVPCFVYFVHITVFADRSDGKMSVHHHLHKPYKAAEPAINVFRHRYVDVKDVKVILHHVVSVSYMRRYYVYKCLN